MRSYLPPREAGTKGTGNEKDEKIDEARRPLRQGGALQDIAPTMLGLFGVPQPKEMTGRDLHLK